MSDLKFTPGPWRLGPINYADVYSQATGELIALVIKDLDGTAGNAHLIAAAPDLYAALEQIVDADEGGEDWAAARAALVKARGNQQ